MPALIELNSFILHEKPNEKSLLDIVGIINYFF
jgi:hypothetical protein